MDKTTIIKKLITRLLVRIKAPVIVKTFTTPSVTVAANNTVWVYSNNWAPTAISGYTPIGVLQATANNQSSLISQMTIIRETYGTRLVGNIRNIASSALTDTIAVPVLYIRNDLYGGGGTA